MKLSEKNDLYLQQKREIERLKAIIEDYERRFLFDEKGNAVDQFLSAYCKDNAMGCIEAKEVFEVFKNWCAANNAAVSFKNRTFYKILESKGYKCEKGNQNKNYILGLEWDHASKTDSL